jgi:hypothetical protein
MAKSAVKSLIDLYNSIGVAHFGGSERPPIFLGKVPQTTSTATQQRVPYVCLHDDSFRPEYDSSSTGIEKGEIRLEVFAMKLDDASGITVDSIARAIRFGGSPPASKAGFDWGSFSFESGTYFYKVSLRHLSNRRDYAGFTTQGPSGESGRVHLCELRYECIIGISPT